MHIILNNSSMVPIYEQIAGQIKSGVISGDLKAGEPLPSVRSMAADHKISALTVKKAYDRLESDGFIITVHGKGSYVAETDRGLAAEARKQAAEAKLAEALDIVRASGMTKEELYELIEILAEDWND